jgi:thiamine-monophosphate kinase
VSRGGALGSGPEFDRIRGFLRDLAAAPGVRVGPGDDAAVLDDGTVLSTDLSVEGVHFRLDWISPVDAGRRAAAAALSDLAAMAARPVGLLASVAAPPPGTLADALMEGVREAAEAAGAPLLGGDLTRAPTGGPSLVDVVVVGRTSRPLLRSGARPGDRLWVTGRLGAAAAAVEAWARGEEPDPAAARAFRDPRPRIAEARWIRDRLGATAGLDLSDGIGGDAGHLAAASGVGVELDGDALLALAHRTGAPADDDRAALDRALHGGEDYELLVALPESLVPSGVEEFRRRFDLSLSPVGRVVPDPGVRLRPPGGGDLVPLRRGGWDHFAPGAGAESSP